MNRGINESDWKRIRKQKDQMLNKACDQILRNIGEMVAKDSGKSHDTYLKVWKQLQADNEDIASMFDNLRRSSAVLQLANWVEYGLLTLEDLDGFTEETQEGVKNILELRR